MTTYEGNKGKLYVGTHMIAEIKSWSLDISSEKIDASTIGTEWRKYKTTIKSWSGSCEAFWDKSDTNGQRQLAIGTEITLNLYPAGNEEGDMYWSGNVLIESLSYSASFEDLIAVSCTFTGNGALSELTVE